jgi:hypothetical protein
MSASPLGIKRECYVCVYVVFLTNLHIFALYSYVEWQGEEFQKTKDLFTK